MNKYNFDDSVHLHSLDGKPLFGTSTIIKVVSKPLSWWASGKAVEYLGWTNKKEQPSIFKRTLTAAPTLKKIKEMDPKQYVELLDRAYANHANSLNKAADAGTDLHAKLEEWVKSVMSGKEITPDPQIMPFVDWCNKFVKKFLWSELHVYSETLWVGGIVDCGVEMSNGDIGLIDFKSSKEAYWTHFIQCGGYALQLEENGGFTATGEKIFQLDKPIEFFAVLPFGAEDKIPRTNHNINQFKEAFKAATILYKNQKEYDG